MSANMKKIKELRERTGAGVLDCKKALTEKDGDVEAAVNYLREKGMSEAAKKAGRVAAEGKVNVLIKEDRSEGIIVEVNSETDFVAKNEKFQELVENISQHILQSDKNTVEEILNEPWFLDDSKQVNTVIKEAIASIGENINLRRFQKYTTSGFLQEYIHMGGKIGVLVDVDAEYNDENTQLAKNLAMHVAASNPLYLTREEVSEEEIKKEKKIYKEQMLNEGKPEHIIDKIVEGKMDKYYTQICLMEQPYVRDTDIAVSDLLEEKNLGVNRFTRYELGEGIEVEEEDFAAEVMSEIENN